MYTTQKYSMQGVEVSVTCNAGPRIGVADRVLENCDLAEHKIGKGTGARHKKRGPAGDAGFFEFLCPISGRKMPNGREASRAYFKIRTTSRGSRPCVAKLSVREFEESCGRNLS